MAADDNGWAVLPEEERGHAELGHFEEVFLGSEVEVDVVGSRTENFYLGESGLAEQSL